MRKILTLVAIFFAAFVLGAIVTPPDPFSALLAAAVLALLGVACYAVGLREGRAVASLAFAATGRWVLRRVLTLVAICFVVFAVGAMVTPLDSFILLLAVIPCILFCVICYVVGLCEGRAAPPR